MIFGLKRPPSKRMTETIGKLEKLQRRLTRLESYLDVKVVKVKQPKQFIFVKKDN